MKHETADEMAHSAVRLPRSLHERLKKAGGERGMGQEIRRRLEASFAAERSPTDVKTRELLAAIASFAKDVARDYGSWSEDRFAFEVLRECVTRLLTHLQPKGEPVPHPKPDGAGDLLFGPDHSIEDITRTIVSVWMSDRAKRGFSDEEKRR